MNLTESPVIREERKNHGNGIKTTHTVKKKSIKTNDDSPFKKNQDSCRPIMIDNKGQSSKRKEKKKGLGNGYNNPRENDQTNDAINADNRHSPNKELVRKNSQEIDLINDIIKQSELLKREHEIAESKKRDKSTSIKRSWLEKMELNTEPIDFPIDQSLRDSIVIGIQNYDSIEDEIRDFKKQNRILQKIRIGLLDERDEARSRFLKVKSKIRKLRLEYKEAIHFIEQGLTEYNNFVNQKEEEEKMSIELVNKGEKLIQYTQEKLDNLTHLKNKIQLLKEKIQK